MKQGSIQWIEHVAKEDPESLFAFIASGPPIHHLTFAAEALGWVPEAFHKQAAYILLELRNHPNRVVQEGAVLGVDNLYRTWEFQ